VNNVLNQCLRREKIRKRCPREQDPKEGDFAETGSLQIPQTSGEDSGELIRASYIRMINDKKGDG
jgi:hypothetical protein